MNTKFLMMAAITGCTASMAMADLALSRVPETAAPGMLARGVNNSGVIVGEAFGWTSSMTTAWRWTGSGSTQNMGTSIPGTGFKKAAAINNAGTATGTYDPDRGFVMTMGGAVTSNIHINYGNTWLYAINDSGIVGGSSGFAPFLYDPSTNAYTTISMPAGYSGGQVTGLNNSGKAVGDTGSRAFLYSGSGTATIVNSLFGLSSSTYITATDISNTDGIVGYYTNPADGRNTGYYFDGTNFNSLGMLPGDNYSFAKSVSDNGLVVGVSGSRAFLWGGNYMIALDDLFADFLQPGWSIIDARAISNNGEFVAATIRTGSGEYAYSAALLQLPTPGSAALLAFAGVFASRRRR